MVRKKITIEDKQIVAKPKGARLSKNGRLYFEYRTNRSDNSITEIPKHKYKIKLVIKELRKLKSLLKKEMLKKTQQRTILKYVKEINSVERKIKLYKRRL